MIQPLVSIIIPTYNRAHLIGETLDSVLAQTYENWECIVVDDGSSDTTDAVVEAYVQKDARFKYVHRPDTHKPGGNGARNYGFLQSKGAYINWFDSDDVMCEEFIELRILSFIKDETVDVVFCAFENYDANSNKLRTANAMFNGDILDGLAHGYISFGPYSFLIKRKRIELYRYDETLLKNQDLDFFFRFFTSEENLKIIHIPRVLFKVIAHNNSMSFNSGKNVFKMKSMHKVHVYVLDYYTMVRHEAGIKRYRFKCLNNLKVMVTNKHYLTAIKELYRFKYITVRQKMYLYCCIAVYCVTGKGANQFVLIKQD